MASPPRGLEGWARRSSAELREMLRRQERLSRNEKFICKLPDKGKKILDTVAKLKAALAECEEVRGNNELLHPVSLDYDLRQKAIAGVDVDIDKAPNSDQKLDTSSPVPDSSSVDTIKSSQATSEKQGPGQPPHRGNEEAAEAECSLNKYPPSNRGAGLLPVLQAADGPPQHCVSGEVEEVPTGSVDSLFIDKLQRITIVDQGEQRSEENTGAETLTSLRSGPSKKPHYVEVLEMRAKNPVPLPHKFKTNVLPSQHSDPPSPSGRGESPVSSEERRRRDKQHLDDITAARLLPLHHLPAQLLSIEESLALQQQQRQSYEEMQAKVAAQKLVERLNIKMQSYNPEGESSGQYREVRDEDDGQSSEDGF
ncbi:protein GRINL1A [Ctenodactylus gundi]